MFYFNYHLSRDTSIRSAVERVLKIWQERKVFDSKVVQKLLDQLYDGVYVITKFNLCLRLPYLISNHGINIYKISCPL